MDTNNITGMILSLLQRYWVIIICNAHHKSMTVQLPDAGGFIKGNNN